MANFGLTNKTFYTLETAWTHQNSTDEAYAAGQSLPAKALEGGDGGDLSFDYTGQLSTKSSGPGTLTLTLYAYDVAAGTYTALTTLGAITFTANLSLAAFMIHADLTIRATGATGSAIAAMKMECAGNTPLVLCAQGAAVTLDLTKSWAFALGADWSLADAANILTLQQAKHRAFITQ
jgi:hypothetical protein